MNKTCFDDLDDFQKQDIIEDGLQLMKSITLAFGGEKGHEIWERVSKALGEDIRNQIFMAALTGEFDRRRVILKGPTASWSETGTKVTAVKAVRNLTNMGFKEAKELVERLEFGKTERVNVRPMSREERKGAFEALQNASISVE